MATIAVIILMPKLIKKIGDAQQSKVVVDENNIRTPHFLGFIILATTSYFLFLNWRAWHIGVGTKHTAMAF